MEVLDPGWICRASPAASWTVRTAAEATTKADGTLLYNTFKRSMVEFLRAIALAWILDSGQIKVLPSNGRWPASQPTQPASTLEIRAPIGNILFGDLHHWSTWMVSGRLRNVIVRVFNIGPCCSLRDQFAQAMQANRTILTRSSTAGACGVAKSG